MLVSVKFYWNTTAHCIYVLSMASSTLQWQSCVLGTLTLWSESLKDLQFGLWKNRCPAHHLCTCHYLTCPCGQSKCQHCHLTEPFPSLCPRFSPSQPWGATMNSPVVNSSWFCSCLSHVSFISLLEDLSDTLLGIFVSLACGRCSMNVRWDRSQERESVRLWGTWFID